MKIHNHISTGFRLCIVFLRVNKIFYGIKKLLKTSTKEKQPPFQTWIK